MQAKFCPNGCGTLLKSRAAALDHLIWKCKKRQT